MPGATGIAARRLFAAEAIRDCDRALVFFRKDDVFGKPKLTCKFVLLSPPAYESPAAAVMSDLFAKLVKVRWALLSLRYLYALTLTRSHIAAISGWCHCITATAPSLCIHALIGWRRCSDTNCRCFYACAYDRCVPD